MKTILGLLMLFPLVVLADASAPTAPTIPSLLTDTPNETAIKNDSTSNQVYIDQAGESVNANINQSGQGNKLGLGTGSDAFKLEGDNQTFTTVQTGNNNTIKGGNTRTMVCTDLGYTHMPVIRSIAVKPENPFKNMMNVLCATVKNRQNENIVAKNALN